MRLPSSILGMQIFGGHSRIGQMRRTFDSLGFSLLTVFELLTTNSWQSTTRDYMRATSDGAAVFFVTWVVLGHFVLLSLFLAIFIERVKEAKAERRAGHVSESELAKVMTGMIAGNALFRCVGVLDTAPVHQGDRGSAPTGRAQEAHRCRQGFESVGRMKHDVFMRNIFRRIFRTRKVPFSSIMCAY